MNEILDEILENVLGDGIYGVRWITDLVSRNNATPYWLEEYHMRSISEAVNSMVKCRFGNTLRKRIDSRKKTETILKLVAHDVRRVGYLEVFGEIEPNW